MPAETAAANRETWIDWLSEGESEPDYEDLLTRDELLEDLRRREIEATDRDLKFWEYEGILPRPVRRWHKGAVRAVYPDWYASLVWEIRSLQRHGYTLEQIRHRIRVSHWYWSDSTTDPPSPDPEELRLPPRLVSQLEAIAQMRERETGIPADRIEVVVTDTHGKRSRYVHPISPPRNTIK